MHTFIENYLHFMKNCIRPHYEKLNPLKSGFIENSNFENNRDPWNCKNVAICIGRDFEGKHINMTCAASRGKGTNVLLT